MLIQIDHLVRRAFALALLAATSVPVAAQQPANPCDNAPFRQFDFWVGEWVVTQRDGTSAGTNRIERILNDCVLQENWTGSGGSIGKSFSHYDWADKAWKQTWVDGAGQRLDLEGGLEGNKMVLRGERPNPRGEGTVQSEITWTPREDGTVTQHWRMSTDGGKTWTDAFFGIYTRRDSENSN